MKPYIDSQQRRLMLLGPIAVGAAVNRMNQNSDPGEPIGR